MKKKSLLLMILLAASCQNLPQQDDPIMPAAEQRYSFRLETEPEQTRSHYSEAETTSVRNAVVAIYTETGTLVHSGRPETAVTLNRNHKYSYYVMTGDLAEESIPERETALSGLVHRYGMDGSDGFVRYHDTWKAIPMAGKVKHRTPSSLDGDGDGVIELPAERLFARISLAIRQDNALSSSFSVSVRSVRIRNFALSVAPFQAELADRGDVSPDEADITESADAAGKWTLYLPENLQGDLLGSNTDPARKTAGALSAAGYNPDLCTFIEVTVDYSSGYGVGGTTRYRFYPGSDNTGNFDIRRNTPYTITLLLTANGLNVEGDWKIDTSDMSDQRELELIPLTPSAAQGGMALLKYAYRESGTDCSSARFDARPGYSVGVRTEVDRYLSGGAGAGHSRVTGIDVMCDDCDHVYPGYPEHASHEIRLAWFRNTLTDGGLGVFLCVECGNDLGNETDAAIYHDDPLPVDQQHPVELIAVPVPAGMAAGSDFALYAVTHDGKRQAEAHVSIFRPGQIVVDKRLLPRYLAMRGSVTVSGLPQGVDGVTFRLVQGTGVVELTPSGRTCALAAVGLGTATIAVLDARTGDELERFSFDVSAPVLSIANPSVGLHPNGDAETVECCYHTTDGNQLRRGQELDESLYDLLLKPVFSKTGNYISVHAATGDVWISSVSGIPTGYSNPIGTVVARAVSCPEAGAPSVSVYCIDPFISVSGAETCLAKIDDHTLCKDGEETSIHIALQGRINAPTIAVKAEPRLGASPACESMEFSITTGNTHVLTVSNHKAGNHAFGKIDILVGVENARSHEYLYRKIGYVEVYLHGQIGGRALLHADPYGKGDGWVSCSTMAMPEKGEGPFDDLYEHLEGIPFIHHTFDETNLYKAGETTYYQSDCNDRYGQNRRPQNVEDRPYLTRYELTPGASDGFCYPSGEVYRIYAGLTDTFFGYFASKYNILASGKTFFLLSFDFEDIPGMAGKGTGLHREYGLASETDDEGVPYRLIMVYRDWMVYDSV